MWVHANSVLHALYELCWVAWAAFSCIDNMILWKRNQSQTRTYMWRHLGLTQATSWQLRRGWWRWLWTSRPPPPCHRWPHWMPHRTCCHHCSQSLSFQRWAFSDLQWLALAWLQRLVSGYVQSCWQSKLLTAAFLWGDVLSGSFWLRLDLSHSKPLSSPP